MPIYEYHCNSCGAEKEHLQKISDAPIAVCPACGSSDYTKLISAAGFQLKGSGWYVTDFRNNKSNQAEAKSSIKENAQPTSTPVTPASDATPSKESPSASTTTAE